MDGLDTNDEHLLFTIMHVFMPPKLPQQEDSDKTRKGTALLNWVADAATHFKEGVDNMYPGDKTGTTAWFHAQKMLKLAAHLHRHGSIAAKDLASALSSMQEGDVLPVLVQAQNAGIIFRKSNLNEISFEAFEVQIPAPKVTGAVGKLVVQYPANSRESFPAKDDYIVPISNLIEYLAEEAQEDAFPHPRKGASSHQEIRDVPSPRYITEGLAGILRAANTTAVKPSPTVFIHKRINDHVLLKSAKLPWRRSPMWLLIRVALQTTLEDFKVSAELGYKAFMISFMTAVIDRAASTLPETMPSHLLHFMNTKLARRLYKMGDLVEGKNSSTLRGPLAVVQQTSSLLEKRWADFQEAHAARAQWSGLDPQLLEGCDKITFECGEDYLRQVIARRSTLQAQSSPYDNSSIAQELLEKCCTKGFDPDRLPENLAGPEPDIALYDFETWVERHLPAWKKSPHRSIRDCLSISRTIDMYRGMALSAYESKPDLLSVMHLCVLELWIALDTIVTQWCPLLLEYSPELPRDLMDPFVLPYREQLERLLQVQVYLNTRYHKASRHGSLSVFDDVNGSSSFANRFFDTTLGQPLQGLKARISQYWELKRSRKISELVRANEEYRSLMRRSDALSCSQVEVVDGWGDRVWQHRSDQCTKCQVAESARRLRITPLEETLPWNTQQAQAIVFELQCPEPFSIWRDVTRAILLSATGPQPTPQSDPDIYPLSNYGTLAEFFRTSDSGRYVGLASSTKSISQSHYGNPRSLPATPEQVITGHVGAWSLFDKEHKSWIESSGESILRKCMTFTVDGLYTSLHEYIMDTSHPPNSIIAALESCPNGLSPNEYLAFCHLRAGNSIQWLNITRALSAQTLTFSEYSVFVLILQSIWQVGPEARADSSDPLNRDAHQDLSDPAFGRELARELSTCLESMHGNWKQAYYLGTVVAIALRLNSLAPSVEVRAQASGVIRQARHLAAAWIKELTKCSSGDNSFEDSSQDTRDHHLATICAALRWTFDLERDDSSPFQIKEDVVQYIHAGIVASPIFARPSLSRGLCILLYRDRRLALKLHHHLQTAVSTDPSSFNECLRRFWPSYSPGSPWTQLSKQGSRWWSTRTAGREDYIPLHLHLNLLDGTLLINGKSSNILPSAVLLHSVYRELFNDHDVGAIRSSTMTGMDYEIGYMEHQVHLRLFGSELVVRRAGSRGVEEFIPASKLRGDLPTSFMSGYHFWYLEGEGNVEIRPISRTWETGHRQHWKMKLESNRSIVSAHLQKSTGIGRKRLINPKSAVYCSLSEALRPLEKDPLGILVTLNDVEKRSLLHARLPRRDISFALNDDGQLECQSAPGFVVQADRRGVGCLFGLESMLCLHQPALAGHGIKVVIPKGKPTVEVSKYGHPKVSIEFSDHGGCYLYDVDRIVGRLVGSRTAESDLFLILLHACTSSTFRDPLTQRTGTEEALARLRSGSVFSAQTISRTLRAYLDQLANFTPRRSFYPEHLRVMEMVEWDPAMSPQSQSSEFRHCVEVILAHWKQGLPFHPEGEAISDLPKVSGMDHLNTRSQYRDWKLPLHDQNAAKLDTHHDSTDSLRSQTSREREFRAFHVVTLAQDATRRSKLAVCRELVSKAQKWSLVTGDQKWSWKRVRGWVKVPSVPAATTWCSLYELCRKTQWPVPFEAQIALGLMAYMNTDNDLIASCIAIMRLSDLMPVTPSFVGLQLSMGSDWNTEIMRSIVKTAEKGFIQSDEYKLPKLEGETHKEHQQRRQSAYNSVLQVSISEVIQELQTMWPQIPNVISFRPQRLLVTSTLPDPVRRKLVQWKDNDAFLQFIGHVENLLLQESGPEVKLGEYRPTSTIPPPHRPFLRLKSLASVLQIRSAPSLAMQYDQQKSEGCISAASTRPETLSKLLAHFSLSQPQSNSLPHRYLQNLTQSVESLEASIRSESQRCPSEEELRSILAVALELYSTSQDTIINEFSSRSTNDTLLKLAGMHPRISVHILLRQLSHAHREVLPAEWGSTLTAYALVIQNVQRAIRMLQHLVHDRKAHLIADFHRRRNWNAENHLDWLLAEIDGNFSIRENQANVASCMMYPDEHGAKNAVMQLNMGEGKSSVIIPAISASLANGQVLCRVIVPRAQTRQQHQLLRKTLTDLSGRIIFSLPFSRNVALDSHSVAKLMQHFSKMAEIGAIWLCEPEQLLSLRLLGLDKTMRTTAYSECGASLIRLQLWLDENTRDILDESDDILNTKQQVIYTVGTQRNFDAAPLRWEVVQTLLGLLAKHLNANPPHEDNQIYAKPSQHPAGFPLIHIRSEHGREELLSFIETSFRRNEWSLPQSLLSHGLRYVSSRHITSDVEELIRTHCSGEDEYVMQTLFILRGLLSSDILLHALKDKRFRVNYGLDLSRTPVAIPFRAKDFPSQRSEFGHPDVTILLTCLSYYHQGLDDSMIHRSIVQLLASDAPDLTYEEWLTDCRTQVRPDLRSLRGINMDDQKGLHKHLYPLLKFNRIVINFYLNEFVFPQYAKEFPEKLCSSGWDLAAEKPHSTTGFSGTNDGRFLLPVTISQLDRPEQMHTNAKVLDYLLLEENSRVVSYPNDSSSEAFLDRVMELGSHPTVILDVGAQILDKSNKVFAQSWLSRYNEHGNVKAAVYFDDKDILAVITFDGTSQPLLDSPYADRLDQCIVYLDDVHTRGTDLRLPDTQAVVTLGPRLNKDKLVQGCMRMRRLGHGHSLVFMAPQDVLEQLYQTRSSSLLGEITSMDVVVWTIQETWRQLQADAPAWMLQGESYIRRMESWEQLRAVTSIPPGTDLAELFCEPEARSLEDLYGVRAKAQHKSEYAAKTRNGMRIMQRIKEHCQGFESFTLRGAGLDEEMEIELVQEKEVEREVQRLGSAEPANHALHPDVLAFVTSGALPTNISRAFRSADAALVGTTLQIPKGFTQVFSRLLFTNDFYRTIEIPSLSSSGVMDQFIRPVEWVVTVRGGNEATSLVVISPYEANALLHIFRQSKRLALHIFSARSSLSVQSMEDLQRFAVPAVQQPLPRDLATSLNLFSGALYIRDKKTYEEVCGLLRLKLEVLPSHLADPLIINSTGFVKTAAARRELGMPIVGFEEAALPFFRKLITMRRYGKGFGPSHMGKLLYGKKLGDPDFV